VSKAKVINRRVAIMGGSESGKSFLAMGFVRGQWRLLKRRAIVFDPFIREHPKFWGPSAWVTADFAAFERAVNGTKGCVVVWDEGTSTGGRDRERIPLFTAIRHNHPCFIFLGHRFDAMLPVMRGSLTDVMLARCRSGDAEEWADCTTDDDVMKATGLAQYEFLHKRMFQPVQILRHTAAQIEGGIAL
jgi:hypothetical protein